MKTTTFGLFWKISGDIRVFGIADHDSDVRITKFKMADPIWRPFVKKEEMKKTEDKVKK